ncbi:hypothetical protein ACFLIM_19405 [Nonomuraea sp. M3C6]|uniref:Uncharacterized protein n=1 Tax=Nonomuraea marmarensis TaxID=3351344 RepID=A0ABW7ADF2_9ACTN
MTKTSGMRVGVDVVVRKSRVRDLVLVRPDQHVALARRLNIDGDLQGHGGERGPDLLRQAAGGPGARPLTSGGLPCVPS